MRIKDFVNESGFGYREAEIIPTKIEIEDWCREHLLHLESKFR